MKKYLIEYFAGNPDTVSEYDDNTDKYIWQLKQQN